MAGVTREQIYSALFTQLQTMAPSLISIPTFSRRFTHWSQVPPNLLPACFQQQYEETSDQQGNMGLTRWHSIVNVWFYYSAMNTNALPDQTYNNVIDALEAALKPPTPSGKQTLGGVVTHAWLDGKIPYSDGATDKKAVILAQIHLLWSGK